MCAIGVVAEDFLLLIESDELFSLLSPAIRGQGHQELIDQFGKSLGFELEGRKRRHLIIDGQYVDLVQMAKFL